MPSDKNAAGAAAFRPGDIPELRQTRDLTQAELRAVQRDWNSLLQRSLNTLGWYRALAYTSWALISFLALSIIMATFAIDDAHPYLAPQLAVALAGSVACWIFGGRYTSNLQRTIYWNSHRAGDRYVLGQRGLQRSSSGSAYDLHWSGVTDIVDRSDRLIMLVNGSGSIFIVKSAFEGQDAQGFCAELMRRWQQTRAEARPGAAT